jgi:hypothetical protein
MSLSIELTKAELRIISAVFANFVVFWIAALFITQNILTLTGNIIFATISWKFAVKAEELLDEYD